MPREERRRFGRRSHCKAASIVRAGHRMSAFIYNMSEHGLLLRTPFVACFDQIFEVEIPSDDVIFQCRVAWSKGDSVGAEFVRSPRRISWQRIQRSEARTDFLAMLRAAQL
jgi:hypothetical protein